MKKLFKYLPYIIIAIVSILFGWMIIRNGQLNQKIDQLKIDNSELSYQIKDLNKHNDSLLVEISILTTKADSLEDAIKIKNKAKIKLVETIKYIEPINDTIETFIALNELNDSLILMLENLVEIKDTEILKQKEIIDNDRVIQEDFERLLSEQKDLYIRERRKKTFWQIATATATGVAIAFMFL